MKYEIEPLATPEAAVAALRELIEAADDELLLSTSARVLRAVVDELRAARARDVLVFLLVGGDAFEPSGPLASEPAAATVVREWDDADHISVICTADDAGGFCALEQLFERPMNEDAGVVFRHPLLRSHVFSTVVGNAWQQGYEAYVADPDPLPATYETFPRAVLNAVLHLREDRNLRAVVDGRWIDRCERATVAGPVCNVRQSFVSPVTSSFSVENGLHVRVDGEVVSVGGPGAFVEDVEAFETTLEPA